MTHKEGIRILVLDDEPFMRKLLTRMLNGLGFASVISCDGGRAALELIDSAESRPDLILLDIHMPDMDGVEFVRHLVGHHYSGALILVSGEDERVLQSVEKLVQAHHITSLGYLSKPIAPELLVALIDKWVPQCTIRAAQKLYSAEELRAAIGNGELINYYQPTVAVMTAAVVGVETLVRWNHAKDGMVFPDQFIGVAEQHGLIDELTRLVLTSALAQARIWRDAGLALRVAVNVSMDNLSSLSFLDRVADLTSEAGVLPQDMVLEVTESRLMHDQRVLLEILTRLRLKRFRLSIDDFGTGNSSLSQLRDIPFDELKIDQGFVHGAWDNDTQRAIFSASLGLARQLGMEAVAEGVEDQKDWDFLRQQRCDLAQGYFIAKPMPAADLPSWLSDWKARIPELVPERRGGEFSATATSFRRRTGEIITVS
jgi:EAL domain-containing protein (putative c-di-GMP-specific phosphodiesterase class I)/FixJ family two-component response regulator